MDERTQPRLVPTGQLPHYFEANNIAYRACGAVELGFGHGKPQYMLYDYPAPEDDEVMGLFCEWHTADFFDVDTGPHLGIGLRGPVTDDPHRGRGLAIGILACDTPSPDESGVVLPLFSGCPAYPGGPSFFVEDFSRNDGQTPIADWQLSPGRVLPELTGNSLFRIDVHVAREHVWAGVWKITESDNGSRDYRFLDQVACSDRASGFAGSPCRELAEDTGRGNAFIGTGFADPDSRSWVDNVFLAHWKGVG
jgi:hypothetical protein